ncbi:MAG: hypothetical protein JW724_02295 [Candidatus Altiarchaeota archaeon]|nr:hypothetical protein [Candidatus Altiarchaeota archaeon]
MWSDKLNNKRAQSSAAEFLIGYFIFFLVLTLAIVLWSSTTSKIANSERLYEFEETCINVAEKLVKTRGVPQNWSREDVTVIGLAETPRTLSRDKLLEFLEIMNDTSSDVHLQSESACSGLSNYECNKDMLGAGKYEFHFNLTDINGTTMQWKGVTYATGRMPVNNSQQIPVTRTAVLENEVAVIRMIFWYAREETL